MRLSDFTKGNITFRVGSSNRVNLCNDFWPLDAQLSLKYSNLWSSKEALIETAGILITFDALAHLEELVGSEWKDWLYVMNLFEGVYLMATRIEDFGSMLALIFTFRCNLFLVFSLACLIFYNRILSCSEMLVSKEN